MRQKDIPAWQELQACVKRICLAGSLSAMQLVTEQEYLAAKTAVDSRYATIEAFINFALRGYLTDPRNPPEPLPHAAPYSGEMSSIQYRLRQLGEL